MMAGLYKDNAVLAAKIRAERVEEEKQQELKKKHNISDENILIVEKPSLVKFLIKLAIRTIKSVAAIIILCLAVIGLLGLIYPAPRLELYKLFSEIIDQTIGML